MFHLDQCQSYLLENLDNVYYPNTRVSSRPNEGPNAGDDGDRLEGASIYPSVLDYTEGQTSALHPWQCSLRTRGFRGRHRCGVTLLSGPTKENPSDPFVLVAAAHCNDICKDQTTGDPLETCCCRPEDNDATCNYGTYVGYFYKYFYLRECARK